METTSARPADLSRLLGYRELLRNLILKDLKVKYRGSYLGFFWSLLHPLSLIVVYSVVLRYVMDVREVEPLMVIAGVIPWVFFSNSLTNSTESIIFNGDLVKKIYFPREILPLATVTFHFIQFGLAFLVFLPAVLYFKGTIPSTMVFYPLIVVLHWTFTLGAALFLSALTTFYKDVRYLTEVATMIVFWATPILYHYGMVSAKGFEPLFRLNPLAAFFFSYQHVVFFERAPLAEHWISMAGWSVAAITVGIFVFNRLQGRFAEEL